MKPLMYMSDYITTLNSIFSKPKHFFDKLPLDGGYEKPIKFAIFSISASKILEFVGNAIFGQVENIFSLLFLLTRNIIGGVLGLFILYGIIHIFLSMLGAKKGFEATFRVGAYMTAFSIFAWIPYFWIPILLYTLYLEIGIFAKIHRISTTRSFIGVMLIPLVLLSLAVIPKLSYIYMSSIQKEVMSTTREGIINLTRNSERNYSMAEIDSVFNKDGKVNVVLRNTGKNVVTREDLKVMWGGIGLNLNSTFSGCDELALSGTCVLEFISFQHPSNATKIVPISFPSNGTPIDIGVLVTTPNQSIRTTYETDYWCKVIGNNCV